MRARKLLVCAVVVILNCVTLPSGGIGAADWQDGHKIRLHAYVCSEVEPIARTYENGDYAGCLKLINEFQPSLPCALNEVRYIKALCLQCLGHFIATRTEYEYVLKWSGDEHLKKRAAIGLDLVLAQDFFPDAEQTLFPDWAPGIDPSF